MLSKIRIGYINYLFYKGIVKLKNQIKKVLSSTHPPPPPPPPKKKNPNATFPSLQSIGNPYPCSLWLPLGLTNLAVSLLVPIMITIPHFYTMDIKHWSYSNLVNNTHLHNTTWPTIFTFILCTIWLARNNLIFKTVSTSLASIDHIIIMEWML